MNTKPKTLTSNMAAAILFIENDNILLLKRAPQVFAGETYALVGGKCDEGENVIQAAIRETYEEVDVHVKEEDLHFVHVMHRTPSAYAQSTKNWVIFFFMVTKWHGTLKNKEPHKHNEMSWWALNNLPSPLTPTHAQAIREWQKQHYFSVMIEK